MKSHVAASSLLGLCLCAAYGQAPQPPASGPVQAELLAHLNVRHLHAGDTLFARVTLDWTGQDCTLRKGAILQATVESAIPRKIRGESPLALSFKKAQCNSSDLQPMDLVLAAVADAPANWTNVPDAQFHMPMSFANPHGNGVAGFGAAGMGDTYITHLELTGIDHRFPIRPGLKPGDVLDIKGMKLDIGTGPNRSSVLTSKAHDVSLATFTQFLLVPAALAFRTSSGRAEPAAFHEIRTGANVPHIAPIAPPPAPVNDLAVCAPPGCALDLPVMPHDLDGHRATSIAVRPLGYAPRFNKIVANFEDEEALAWLGPHQLLFTFNPHRLIRRPAAGNSGQTMRIMRAVLLDPATHNVLRAVDWEITDARRYLWPLDGDRILVHVGNELRVYRPGLEVERTFPLPGPLSFVRIAPNGALIALGTLRERHSQELHSQLHEQFGGEPEEDVEIAILNNEFKIIASASTTSGLVPPTMLNEGQVMLLAQPSMWYRLALKSWDDKSTTLARFQSRCTPELTSIAPDLLFLLSCNVSDGSAEYRVLRPDGKQLLRGTSDPHVAGQEAAGGERSRTFAVKAVRADREISAGVEFRGSDLETEEVRVYRADDGKRLLAVRIKEPIASRGGYALSPDGSQLAVLSASQISFFPVPVQ